MKYTKNNKAMAFLTVEDLFGTVEVIVFPRDYERSHHLMNTDAKVFIRGKATVEEDKNGKLIYECILLFEDTKKELWLQFATKEEFVDKEDELYDAKLRDSDGKDTVVIYISSIKAMKKLPKNYSIHINEDTCGTI